MPPAVTGGGITPVATTTPTTLAGALNALAAAVTQLTGVVNALTGAGVVAGGGITQVSASTAPVAAAPSAPEPVAVEPTKVEKPKAVAPAAPAAAPPRTEALINPVDAKVSSPFGMRDGILHTGSDYAVGMGTPIKAAAGGTVVFSGWEQGGGGNVTIIDHGDGIQTLYAHQSELIAKVGAVVKQGDVIGKVGSTGNSTGPHLHFEVIEGERYPGGAKNAEEFMASGRKV